jgi:hypothetical protein
MTERQAYGKALHILIVVVAMLSSNMLLERICFATSVERVLLTGVIIAGIWIFMYRKHAGLRQELWKYKESGVLIAGDMAGLFIAVGLFAESFAVSHWMEHIARGLTWFFDFLGVFAPCLIPMIIVLFSMIGMHPFISIILVGGMAASISGMVTPAVLGVALINGCVLSFLLSPFMGITLILSSLIQCSPMDISFKSNRQFFIAYYMLSFVYLLLLQKWI